MPFKKRSYVNTDSHIASMEQERKTNPGNNQRENNIPLKSSENLVESACALWYDFSAETAKAISAADPLCDRCKSAHAAGRIEAASVAQPHEPKMLWCSPSRVEKDVMQLLLQ